MQFIAPYLSKRRWRWLSTVFSDRPLSLHRSPRSWHPMRPGPGPRSLGRKAVFARRTLDPAHVCGREDGRPGRDELDSLDDIFNFGRLQEVPSGTPFVGSSKEAWVVVRREHQEDRSRSSRKSFEDAQAIHVATELHVTDRDIGIKFDDQALGRRSVSRDADEAQRLAFADRLVDGVPDSRMVDDRPRPRITDARFLSDSPPSEWRGSSSRHRLKPCKEHPGMGCAVTPAPPTHANSGAQLLEAIG